MRQRSKLWPPLTPTLNQRGAIDRRTHSPSIAVAAVIVCRATQQANSWAHNSPSVLGAPQGWSDLSGRKLGQTSRVEQSRWSWARDKSEAVAFQEEAFRLVGHVLSEVRYFTVDYGSDQYRGDAAGPRNVTSPLEWAAPCWLHPACDSVDFAVEFRTEAGRVFTASWDSPGDKEGIGLREGPALGMAVTEEAVAAIWDVSGTVQWRDLIGRRVDSVELMYQTWNSSESLWCQRIDLVIERRLVTLLLADGALDGDALAVSADNIAAVFGGQIALPWEFAPTELP